MPRPCIACGESYGDYVMGSYSRGLCPACDDRIKTEKAKVLPALLATPAEPTVATDPMLEAHIKRALDEWSIVHPDLTIREIVDTFQEITDKLLGIRYRQ